MDALTAAPALRTDRTPGPPAAPTTPAPRAAGRRRVRPGPRPVPQTSREHDHLSLDGLRTYRAALQHEEGRVSYWRRILQARLDVVREGRSGGGSVLDPAALRPVLTDRRMSTGRDALVQVMPADDIPPLPALGELWERRVDPSDEPALTALEQDLDAAERQLSAYRTALHQRLEQATEELIARYREQPALCLSALPLPVPAPRPGGRR